MAFPEPEVGLVVSYSYLWSDEAAAGHVEGRKARPSAIVMAVRHDEEHPPRSLWFQLRTVRIPTRNQLSRYPLE